MAVSERLPIICTRMEQFYTMGLVEVIEFSYIQSDGFSFLQLRGYNMLPVLKISFMFFSNSRLLPVSGLLFLLVLLLGIVILSIYGHITLLCVILTSAQILSLQPNQIPLNHYNLNLFYFYPYHLLPSDLLYTCCIYIFLNISYTIYIFKIDNYLLYEMGLSALNRSPFSLE